MLPRLECSCACLWPQVPGLVPTNEGKLHVSVIGLANRGNWHHNEKLPITRDMEAGLGPISLNLGAGDLKLANKGKKFTENISNNDTNSAGETQLFINSLLDILTNDRSIIGFYISLDGNNIQKKYALLTSTPFENVWTVFMLSSLPETRRDAPSKNVQKLKYPPVTRDTNSVTNSFAERSTFSSLNGTSELPASISMLDSKRLELLTNRMTRSNSSFTGKVSRMDKLSEPTILPEKRKPEDVLKDIDPVEFMLDKYFSLLYSSSNMLEHFVKSSITKMHLLRRDNVQLAKECMLKLRIGSLNNFEKRHEFDFADNDPMETILDMWCAVEAKMIDKTEMKYRLKRAQKLKSLKNHASLMAYLDSVKIKDLKLQILVALELLKLINNDPRGATEATSLSLETKKVNDTDTQPKRPQMVKRYSSSLVGRKRNRKRLIPTLLGTVMPASINFDVDLRDNTLDQGAGKVEELNSSNLINLIIIYFEKLCVYDAVKGYDYKHINSSWSFLSNCVLPFYEKYHKKLLSDLAVKSRGPAFLLKLKAQKEKKDREQRRKMMQKEGSSCSKIERKPTGINLSEIRLNRSHSSFSAPKVDMSRKTFSMETSTLFASFVDSPPINVTRNNSINSDPALFSDISRSSEPANSTDLLASKKRKLLAPHREKKRLKGTSSSELHDTDKESNDCSSSNNKTKQAYSIFHHNQVIEATPVKSIGLQELTSPLVEYSFVKNTPKLINPTNQVTNPSVTFRRITPPRGSIQCTLTAIGTETQISETPQLERVQIRPGVFEIGSSPLKSAEKRTRGEAIIIAAETPLKATPMIVDSSPVLQSNATVKAAKSISRKLDFA
jgi:hypothetical protein